MNISSFKLKFQISQTTHFATSNVIDRILVRLQDKKYQISNVTNSSVRFGQNTSKLVWNFKAPYVLDGGNFEITRSEQETVVVLSYFINVLPSLLIIIALLIFVVIQGEYFGIFFFGLFYIIAGSFQYTITKSAGRELLTSVLVID
jgi:hypothetical protein